ncbi:MAG: S46 family peptidase [Prolixibacteraceae bacterium]
MLRKNTLLIGFLILSVSSLFAKEGMWIPTLLNKYNIEEMQQMGFRLTTEDIYSVNHASMKDAVVLFGSGCTGELISDEGLLITNHHCGFDAIQNHSSVEHDYLTDGFWAKSHQEELPNPELSVRFLHRMDDVSTSVLSGTEGKVKDSVTVIIRKNIKKIINEAAQNGKYEAAVQPLFYGNQYFLYVYEVFTDIRLVGAPPSSIGKFGGDTDNWMWPRHTGDFSIFRIYAGKDNLPAKYSPENVPFKPKKFFKISIKGIQPNDFTMVLGYPGRTQEFLPSAAINQIMQQSDPDKIKIRDLKLDLLSADMEKDAKVRIQYAAKYASTSNAWKKWQGEVKGLRQMNAVEVKKKIEKEFLQWANADPQRKLNYEHVVTDLENRYNQLAPYNKANDYYDEIIRRGTDLFNLVSSFEVLEPKFNSLKTSDQEKIEKAITLKLEDYFKEYNFATDQKIFVALLTKYAKDLDPAFLPEVLKSGKFQSNPEAFLLKIYKKSIFTNPAKLADLTSGLTVAKFKKLSKDPAFVLFRSIKNHYTTNVESYVETFTNQIDENMKTYVAGILEMNNGKPIWADANKTMRISYGKVEGYEPMDGVIYNYFTTLEGVIQKDNPEIYDYNVPENLRELYRKKDYGRYGKNGQLNVCFTASNHTTGGNSGSPVLNADGELIGLNFDRCWEGTMSDLMFDQDRCRNITLDIRYALFLVDKLSGAGYLLDEMEIVE